MNSYCIINNKCSRGAVCSIFMHKRTSLDEKYYFPIKLSYFLYDIKKWKRMSEFA